MDTPREDNYSKRLKRIEDAVRLEKPDRVPIIVEFGYFIARYSGITYQDIFYDPVKCSGAYKKIVTELEPDAFHCLPFDSGLAMETIDSKTTKWPGRGLLPNQGHQYIEGEYMLMKNTLWNTSSHGRSKPEARLFNRI